MKKLLRKIKTQLQFPAIKISELAVVVLVVHLFEHSASVVGLEPHVMNEHNGLSVTADVEVPL